MFADECGEELGELLATVTRQRLKSPHDAGTSAGYEAGRGTKRGRV